MDRFSQPVLRETSCSDNTSTDEELSDWRLEDKEFARGMIRSNDVVDQRMIDIFRIRKLHE